MKKMIYSHLLRLSAAALTCTALLSGTPSFIELKEHNDSNPPIIDIQDGEHGTEGDDGENKGSTTPKEPGIQPLEDWEHDVFKH